MHFNARLHNRGENVRVAAAARRRRSSAVLYAQLGRGAHAGNRIRGVLEVGSQQKVEVG
jgi:hypothetical protein